MKPEEGGDDVKSSWPLMPRATHVLQWPAQSVANPRGGANRKKSGPSSDWRLQLASMKVESLVIADQQAAVNTFSGLVHTARHTTKVNWTRSLEVFSCRRSGQ